MPVIDDLLPDLCKARVFSVKNGFWHVQLDDESSKLTTFAIPWGRFRWLRMPFGIAPAPEEFQRRLNEALEGLDGVRTIADDIIDFGVGDTDDEAVVDHDLKLMALLQRCRQRHIKLNKDKMKFKLAQLSYVGHVILAEGLRPDPAKVEAILNMPPPTDKQGLRRIMGMVNYLQKFAPGLSELTTPIRILLKDDAEFVWEESVQGECFKRVKAVIASAPVLKYFDPSVEAVLQCDASQHGLGACLMQNGQPVAYASRSLTETECNYVQMEKGLLAIVFGVEKFESYLYGRKFKVETDHKPLESILKNSLLSAPKRLQRMMLRLQNFDFEVEYKKGTLLHLADTLSRAYLPHGQIKCSKEDVFLTVNVRSPVEEEIEAVDALSFVSISPQGLDRVQRAMEADSGMVLLKTVIQTGWPDTKEEVPVSIQGYFHFGDELSVQDGLVLKGERLVVPQSMREEIKQKLHQSHLGIQGCLRRGKEVVYWPGMNKDIEDFISSCSVCKSYQTDQQKEPMISHEIPSRLWEKACLAGTDPNLSLLDYRNTPTEGVGSSPAQRLFGRRTKTLLPTSSRLLVPGSVHGVPHKLKERKAKQAYYYDRGAKELNRLKPGDVVRVKLRPNSKEWTRAAVDKEVDIRSYQVRTEDGRTYRRNRRHLRQTREPFLRAAFVESSTDLAQQQQPKGVVPSGNVAAPEVPTRKPTSKVPPTRKYQPVLLSFSQSQPVCEQLDPVT